MEVLMTKDDWIQAEKKISLYTSLELKIDNDNISICMRFVGKTELNYVVFINGVMKGLEDEEKQVKYRRKIVKPIYSTKLKKKVKKYYGKNYLKEWPTLDDQYIWYSPFFKSFKTLKNQYIKRHPKIYWVKD